MARFAVALLLGAALLGALPGCGSEPGELANGGDGTRAPDPGYSATDARIVETDASGAPRYTLSAATIRQDPLSLGVALERIAMQVREGQEEGWRIDAIDGVVGVARHDHSSVPAGTDQSRSTADIHVVPTRSASSFRSSAVNTSAPDSNIRIVCLLGNR